MKLRRQQLILEIIEEKPIATQEELAKELRARGIKATQATISRDIKELQLVKIPAGKDSYRYARPGQQIDLHRAQDRLRRIFQDSVTGIDYCENLVIVKTLPGGAQSVASAIDQVNWKEVIGTVAGDDTILIVVKPKEKVTVVVERLKSLLE
jgi:transcriptional regulator of arginine metabolism